MAALAEGLRDIRDGQGHIAVDRNLPGRGTRLGQLPEPVDVMALRGPPAAEIDGRRIDGPADFGRERTPIDEHAGREAGSDRRQ